IDLPVAATVAPKPVVVAPPPPPKVVEKSIDRAEQKVRAKRIKKIDEEIAALEARIASAEGDRERNDLLLCSEEVFRDGERVKKIQQQNHDLKAMIDLLYGKWETLSKEKEELESAVPSS
ncbi:MAG TPA: ABC transporter C-terminal domain-containing protein, partial [Thermoanaerobaculia bacterium]